jgi:long-chain acyl-CoA synthetase
VPKRVLGRLPGKLRDNYALARGYGNQYCLIYQEQRHPFPDVLRRVAALGSAPSERHGVGKGDRGAIALRNCPELCLALMAITPINAVAVPMNSRWNGEELAYGLEDSAAKLVILEGARHEGIAEWLPRAVLELIGMRV